MASLRVAAFISHPIQYFSPLWRELTARPGVSLRVYYFSEHGLAANIDPGFGVAFAWDIDLLGGHEHRFLPRRWPTRDPLDHGPRALNQGLVAAVREGWDAVFVNGYAHANNWIVAAAARASRVPVMCFADSNLRDSSAKPMPLRAAKRLILPPVLRASTAFLAAGGATRAYFEHYGVASQSVFICPYAVDVARFRSTVANAGADGAAALRVRWGIPANARVVMFCGKLAAWKRPLDVLLAVERLKTPDVVAVFVGDGELKAELSRRGGSRAVLPGFVNQSEIPVALSLADVLVLSSEREPYGMVVAEAQALGVPAVVSAACGCHGPEAVVQDGESGFVYPTGDAGALADRLDRILCDSQLAARMRARAARQGETQSQAAAADGFLDAVRYAQRAR